MIILQLALLSYLCFIVYFVDIFHLAVAQIAYSGRFLSHFTLASQPYVLII